LHDIGKLAERAGAFPSDQRLEANLQLYCPYHEQGRWFSHKHAAYSALAIDLLADDLPDLLLKDPAPFTGRQHADALRSLPRKHQGQRRVGGNCSHALDSKRAANHRAARSIAAWNTSS
jgi:hypothetical protein